MGLIVSAVGNVAAHLASAAGLNWPGGLPSYVGIVASAVAVTIAVSLPTDGATGTELDARTRLVMDL